MKRCLAAAAVLVALGIGHNSPVRAQDEIRYFNRAKKEEASLRGTIEAESPAEIVLKLRSGRAEKIPVEDVIEVSYEPPSGVNRLDYRRPTNKDDQARKLAGEGSADERKKAVQEAVAAYRELLPKLAPRKLAQRHMQFRLAQFLAWEAENDPARVDEAVKALQQFHAEHPDAWAYTDSVKALARLLESKGDAAAAQKLYESVAARDDLPRAVRQDFDLLVVRKLLENGKHSAAEARLKKLGEGLSESDPQAQRLQVYLAACEAALRGPAQAEKQLEALIAKAQDAEIQALAHNTLGDVQLRKGTPEGREAAFWNYLWVDVLYNQDRVEHARALYHLARLFDEVRKDDARAVQCVERLKDKRFDGVEYQKRALEEEKAATAGTAESRPPTPRR